LETEIYGVWRYPEEAERPGREIVTPAKITFNRKGEIENVQLLDSSGSEILDNEVFKTLSLIDPLAPLPKGYKKDRSNLIVFFPYNAAVACFIEYYRDAVYSMVLKFFSSSADNDKLHDSILQPIDIVSKKDDE
jgi:TonB family protein